MAGKGNFGKSKLTPDQWLEIERRYRSGGQSIGGIASEFKVSKTAIIKKAKAMGWERDRVEARNTVRAVVGQLVTGGLVITDEDIISAAAVQAHVTREHREGTSRLRSLVTDLTDELSIYLALIRDLRQTPPAILDDGRIDQEDDRYKKAKLMLAVMGNPIDGAKALAQALRHLIIADRLIHGIDTVPGGSADPDEAAIVLAKLRSWDKSVAEEMAKRPYLLAKPAPPPAGSNGHAKPNGHANGHAH